MKLDDVKITEVLVKSWKEEFLNNLEVDVVIAGGGPAGLTCAFYLAKENKKVVVFERNLAIGGGAWGGGMMFNICVFQEKALDILNDFDIKPKKQGEYYIVNSIEFVSKLATGALSAGAKIFNLIGVEDLVIDGYPPKRVCGVVILWKATTEANLHVDPLSVKSKYVVDATGHAAELAQILVRKVGKVLLTKDGDLQKEAPMCAEEGERLIVENTKEAFAGLYIAGMATNAVFGGPRMGPIFWGMLLSGKKVAQLILKNL